MKWVELDIPAAGSTRDPLIPILRELTSRPGQWAELGRYPLAKIGSARSRGSQIKRRHAGIEYAVLPVAEEAVLYLRADPAYDVHITDNREAQP